MSWTGFEKFAPLTMAISISAMVISRAPTLVNEFSAIGIKFNINAGYVVVFSVPTIMLLLAWLWINRDKSVLEKKPYVKNNWLALILVTFPSIASLFMFIQFVTEFSPQGECNTFSVLRYFWDTSLWEMKPEYCFNLLDDIQKFMPYIYPPFQTWVYLLFVGASMVFSIKLWRYYSA